MKDLLIEISKALVDSPEEVQVNETVTETTVVYELAVSKPDMGKIIGKEGRIAKAIRTIMKAAAAKQHKRAVLEIVE